MEFRSRGLYLITPDEADTERLVARVQPLLPHAVLLQYRNKQADAQLRDAQARALRRACDMANVALIINDDVELAQAVAADGVHLGEDDSAISSARARLGPRAIVGASCYDDLQRARTAVTAGSSYVAFGAVFPSSTKPNARRADTRLFAAASALGVPRVAIGGISPANARQVVAMGADLIAVISGVFDAPDPVAAARACAAAFAE